MGVGRLSTAQFFRTGRLIPRHKHCKTMVTTSTQEACCVFPSGGTEHQVFSVQDEFLTFSGCQTHGAKGRAPSGAPLMIRNHPCQPWEGRWSVGLPAWTTSRLPPLKMQRETTVDDRSSCTVMSVVMLWCPSRGAARGTCLHSPCSVSSFGAGWGS